MAAALNDYQKLCRLQLGRFPEPGTPIDPSPGGPLGPLAGVPVAIKDVLCTQGEPTTCGSRMLKEFRPPYDATAITRNWPVNGGVEKSARARPWASVCRTADTRATGFTRRAPTG